MMPQSLSASGELGLRKGFGFYAIGVGEEKDVDWIWLGEGRRWMREFGEEMERIFGGFLLGN